MSETDEEESGRAVEVPLIGDHPLAKLPDVAREMVAAATRVILRDGYGGFTVRKAAAEANVYADAIRYYFGGKKGLVEAVALSVSHDLAVSTLQSVHDVDDENERLHAMAQANRIIAEGLDNYRVYWELLPHILADRDWTVREADDYEWYRRLYAHFSVSKPASFADLPNPQRAWNLASLLMAVGDGLALQKCLDPERVDLSAIFALWDEIVGPALADTFGVFEPASS